MHDSRGAAIKVGDHVLIEAEVTELQNGDENFCCCAVKVVTPDQPGKEKVMQPPTFSAMSTKMLTKVGAALAFLLLFAADASACHRANARGHRTAVSATTVKATTTTTVTTATKTVAASSCSSGSSGGCGARGTLLHRLFR